jgi:hypothetical protein
MKYLPSLAHASDLQDFLTTSFGGFSVNKLVPQTCYRKSFPFFIMDLLPGIGFSSAKF